MNVINTKSVKLTTTTTRKLQNNENEIKELVVLQTPTIFGNYQYSWKQPIDGPIVLNMGEVILDQHKKIINSTRMDNVLNVLESLDALQNGTMTLDEILKNYIYVNESQYLAWSTLSSELIIHNINSKQINGIIIEEAEISRKPYEFEPVTYNGFDNFQRMRWEPTYESTVPNLVTDFLNLEPKFEITISKDQFNYFKNKIDFTMLPFYNVKNLYSGEMHTQTLRQININRPFIYVPKTTYKKDIKDYINVCYDNNFISKIMKLYLPPNAEILLTSKIEYNLIPNNGDYYTLFINNDNNII